MRSEALQPDSIGHREMVQRSKDGTKECATVALNVLSRQLRSSRVEALVHQLVVLSKQLEMFSWGHTNFMQMEVCRLA